MYLSQHEIARTREHALSHLLDLSSAQLETSQRLVDLFSSAGRDYIHVNSKNFAQFGHGQLDQMTQFPAALWLDQLGRNSRMLEAAYEIMADAHKHLIENAEQQVKTFDAMIMACINRATRCTPWEGEIALAALRTTLESAEQTLHGMSTAAMETVDASEHEVHQISASLSPETPPKKTGRSRRTAKTAV